MSYGDILGQRPDLNSYALKTDLSNYLPLTGGTVTGPTTVNGVLKTNQNPTQALQVATKQYVDTIFASDRVLLGSTVSTFTNSFNARNNVSIQCNSSATNYKYLELVVTMNNNSYNTGSSIGINLYLDGSDNDIRMYLTNTSGKLPPTVYFNIRSFYRYMYNDLNKNYYYHFTKNGYLNYQENNTVEMAYIVNGGNYISGNISLNFQLYGIN